MTLSFGRIVWAEVADANGIRKVRPAVVITPTEEIGEDSSVEVVAVSTRLSEPLPEDHVLLPWHAQGHPRTKLNRRCAAVCSWVARITPADVQGMAGVVPDALLNEILDRLEFPPPPAEGEPPSAAP